MAAVNEDGAVAELSTVSIHTSRPRALSWSTAASEGHNRRRLILNKKNPPGRRAGCGSVRRTHREPLVVLESDQRRPGARHPHDLALGTRCWTRLDGSIPIGRASTRTTESAEATALFRYRVIAAAIGPRLSPAERLAAADPRSPSRCTRYFALGSANPNLNTTRLVERSASHVRSPHPDRSGVRAGSVSPTRPLADTRYDRDPAVVLCDAYWSRYADSIRFSSFSVAGSQSAPSVKAWRRRPSATSTAMRHARFRRRERRNSGRCLSAAASTTASSSRHVVELLTRTARAGRDLGAELSPQPTLVEVGQHLEIDPDRINEARCAARMPVSLEAPVGEDGHLTRGNLICDDTVTEAAHRSSEASNLSERLQSALDELHPREQQVLRLRFGLDRGYERTRRRARR